MLGFKYPWFGVVITCLRAGAAPAGTLIACCEGAAPGSTPIDCWGMLKYCAGGPWVEPIRGVAPPWAIAWVNWARPLMACWGDMATTVVVVGVTCLSCPLIPLCVSSVVH